LTPQQLEGERRYVETATPESGIMDCAGAEWFDESRGEGSNSSAILRFFVWMMRLLSIWDVSMLGIANGARFLWLAV
jgi:hypothetical protein